MRYPFVCWEGDDGHSTGIEVTPPAGEDGAGGTAAGNAAAGKTHTVRQGETLWGIAQNYGLELTELIRLNPQIKNPNLIVVGEEVRVA